MKWGLEYVLFGGIVRFVCALDIGLANRGLVVVKFSLGGSVIFQLVIESNYCFLFL